MKAILS